MSDHEPAQQNPNYGGWASFEVEIRARRYSRCLKAAEEALAAGRLGESREWIAEARNLSSAAPELDELERRIAAWSEPTVEPLAPVVEPPAPIVIDPPVSMPAAPDDYSESLIAERFREPDPGLRAEPDSVRPVENILFASSPVEERPAVGWITVVAGMATMAILVGGVSFGIARFFNGAPLDSLFKISRAEEAQTPAVTKPGERPPTTATPSTTLPTTATPEPSTPAPAAPEPSTPAPPSAQSELPVATPEPNPAASPTATLPEAATRTRPDSVPEKPVPEAVRGSAARDTTRAGAATVREPRSVPAPPAPQRPLSSGRLTLPPPPSPAPAPASEVTRPVDQPAVATPAAAATTGTVPALPPAEAAPTLSPATNPATTSTSTRTTPDSHSEDTALIRAVLSRYEAAYNRLDARAASAVWPKVNEGALNRAFDGLLSQRVALGLCDIAVIGDLAGASCAGKARWEPKVGGGVQTADRYWKFNLRKTPDGWKIENIMVR
jgi:hypothetical protein